MENPITEFELEEIEDVKIIIKAKGKHFSMIPKEDISADDAKAYRVASALLSLQHHTIVNTALEDLKK